MLTARLSATHAALINATACRIGPPSFGPPDTAHLGFVHGQLPLAQLAPATLLEDGVKELSVVDAVGQLAAERPEAAHL